MPSNSADPTSHISAITACTALEREPGGLVRVVVVSGSIHQRKPDALHPLSRIAIQWLRKSPGYTTTGTAEIVTALHADLEASA